MPWYQSLFAFWGRLLRSLVFGWSLEQKSLLFFGLALILPIGLSFWLVLQVVANRLVMQTTRQAARDYARAEVAWRHAVSGASDIKRPVFPGGGFDAVLDANSLRSLRKYLIENPEYETELLMLDTRVAHQHLPNATRPGTESEEQQLLGLEAEYRVALQRLRDLLEEYAELWNGAIEDETSRGQTARMTDIADEVRSLRQQLERLYRDKGPYFPDGEETAETSAEASSAESRFADPFTPLRIPPAAAGSDFREATSEIPGGQLPQNPLGPQSTLGAQLPLGPGAPTSTPEEGWYVYYHPIYFPDNCLGCHHRFQKAQASEIPFRVMRVKIPYRQVQVASTETLAWLITISMVTVAGTLFVVHWVLRRLVLTPLRHLHTVSDEISRGNTNLRANIDTGDEFNELADAFNRMLRHMTDSQGELKKLNNELDLKVDQLAQLNLHLYEANRLKSDFLANMSHELRTPLNSIIGFSDVLQDISSLNEKQKKYATNIQQSGRLLLSMINDILDLAKVEAGKMQVTPTTFDLRSLISGQCDMLRSIVDEKNVDLKIECATDFPPVFQDQAKLQQILTNLLSNAIKFTPDGGVIVVRVELRDPDIFAVTVADTGVGIPESDFDIIFEKFRQSNSVLQNDGLTRQYAGTGLGLSIVKELCKLLGGEIRLSSQLGTGSTFTVLLPVHYEAGVDLEAIAQ